jgi:hypothetical protein
MRKTLAVASACAAALLSALGAATASADGVVPSGIGQSAGSGQSASSTATSTQTGASNTAVNLNILSPGAHSGDVNQANNSGATSSAGNTNTTTQNASQYGGGNVQGVGQAAYNGQDASSTATSTQDHPSNTAINVSILSPGASSGSVNQANNSYAESSAGNTNTTTQNASQGGGGGGGGVQGIGQEAKSHQDASSTATSTQDHPSNTAINLSILGGKKHDGGCCNKDDGYDGKKVDGYDDHAKSGDVNQANNSGAVSSAGNTNTTTQNATQGGGKAPYDDKKSCDGGCDSAPRCDSCDGHDSPIGVQGIGQLAKNHQSATSSATSTQTSPSNKAITLNILSPGAQSGDVNQANNSYAESSAGNTNTTTQNASQGGKGWGVQGIGQEAFNWQDASSAATSTQYCPENVAVGPFKSVNQANNSGAVSSAGNTNTTTQNAPQWWWFRPVAI